MAIQASGKLLVKVRQRPLGALLSGPQALTLAGYRPLEPLFNGRRATSGFAMAQPADHWLLATAQQGGDAHPWDEAHRAARSAPQPVYVEPDLLQRTEPGLVASAVVPVGFDRDWPPAASVSPAWHLLAGFTGFEGVRAEATGNGVRIAILDTGYWPEHVSTPRRMRRDLGYNFYENNTNTTDPGIAGVLRNPGHGTATLAILAGSRLDLIYQGRQYSGDFGGAPDAEVVPVRISPSVVHFYSSTMAQGLDYALAPSGDPAQGRPENRCDVVSISHGGLPSDSWADAVDNLYDAGIVVVAASGDNFAHLPTRFVVYPSAFNRVVTALGATYDKTPYVTAKPGELQGNWGPEPVMAKAIAGYTPNVAWMKRGTRDGFDMDGAGTSASTPQIAAACALWVERYGSRFAQGWQRVEACRAALFRSAAPGNGSETYLGRGVLDVPAMLGSDLADAIEADIGANRIQPTPRDDTSFPFLRLLLGLGPPGSDEERMYETEALQLVYRAQNAELLAAFEAHAAGTALPPATISRARQLLKAEPDISAALSARL